MPARSWTACSRRAERRRQTMQLSIREPTFHFSFPAAAQRDRIKIHQAAINRKSCVIATCYRVSTAASCNLLHESRTRPQTIHVAPPNRGAIDKNDFADNTLREGLP